MLKNPARFREVSRGPPRQTPRAAVKAGDCWLAIIGVLTSVVSVFFYLRIVVLMYMSPAEAPARFPRVPKIAGAALVVSAVLVFYLGILRTRVLDWAAATIF